jgi:hypothetical protein
MSRAWGVGLSHPPSPVPLTHGEGPGAHLPFCTTPTEGPNGNLTRMKPSLRKKTG